MVFLAKGYSSGKIFSIKKISEKEGIPFVFLEKIIHKLSEANLVESRKGVSGGYLLSKSPSKINAKNIVSVLESNKKPVDCRMCSRKSGCLTKNVWGKLDIALSKTLESITLSDLIK